MDECEHYGIKVNVKGKEIICHIRIVRPYTIWKDGGLHETYINKNVCTTWNVCVVVKYMDDLKKNLRDRFVKDLNYTKAYGQMCTNWVSKAFSTPLFGEKSWVFGSL